MLQILHKGSQISLPLNPALDTMLVDGIVYSDSVPAYLAQFVGGKVVTMEADGYVALCDGADSTKRCLGFVIDDAAGSFFENKPAVASGQLGIASLGFGEVITDQINTTKTFKPGDLLYADTGANAGLVTNATPATGSNVAQVIGIAGSAASLAAPSLTIFLSI